MANKCQVCVHSDIKAIDKALVDGVPIRHLVQQYGVSRDALYRHKNLHLPKVMVKAKEVKDVAKADSLLEQLKSLQANTLEILNRHKGKDDRLALSAVREARSNLDLLGRLLGELDESPKVAVLINNPEWVEVRGVIVKALEGYPEAKAKVVNALQRYS